MKTSQFRLNPQIDTKVWLALGEITRWSAVVKSTGAKID